MPKDRYEIQDNASPHFVTLSVVEWIPVFTNRKIVRAVMDSLRFMQETKRLSVYGYVIMENHMHMVVESEDLQGEISKFKSFTARRSIDLLGELDRSYWLSKLHSLRQLNRIDREHGFWQKGCHPKQILNDAMMRQKIQYIHHNPVKRGYVSQPWYWRYSSAGYYRYGKGLLPVCTDW